ncbi:DUF4330 family protein [Halosimplex amylolyticum]|uniref:DUF4330 family protein n=1 Tax=Halosimplex amylolyticum TaxID=3396616 RepID=UPI003F55FCB2
MAIIDEDGRIFGTINVVDALAVLLVLAVAAAGIALVTGSDPGEEETRHVTLDLGSQPEYVLEQLDTGDTASLENEPGNMTITDAHFTPGESNPQALVRVEVTGTETEDSFTYGGRTLRLGRTLQFETDEYVVNGTIQSVGNQTDLPTQERTVILRGTVPNDVARDAEAGIETRIANQTVASVTDVAVYDTNRSGRRALFLAVDLRTYGTGDSAEFAGTRVEVGQNLVLPVAGYQFTGEIERTAGNLTRSSEKVLVTNVVDKSVARQIEEGDAYRVAGESIAIVESVTAYGTDDPDRNRIFVGLSVRALTLDDRPQFGANRTLREDTWIPFRTDGYEFGGRIVRTGTATQPGETAERTVELELRNVTPERANSLSAGMTETAAGRTVARVTDVSVDPAVVVLKSESGDIYEREHPVNKDVTLTAQLQVRELDNGIRFKGQTMQEGNNLVLNLGTTTIEAEVVDLDTE